MIVTFILTCSHMHGNMVAMHVGIMNECQHEHQNMLTCHTVLSTWWPIVNMKFCFTAHVDMQFIHVNMTCLINVSC